MSVAELIDLEAMSHIANFGCVKGMDKFALHMLKTSEHPILRFRREWMRRIALNQHLEAEKNQKKINSHLKSIPRSNVKNMRHEGVIDNHLAAEMRHYNNAEIKEMASDIRAEAPDILPNRD